MIANVSCRRIFSTLSSVALLCACVSFLLSTNMAFAQVDQGALVGRVVDTTGAVIPGAAVDLTNMETGFAVHRTANGSGFYTFAPIKIGVYEVKASAPGFQTTIQQNVRIDIQSHVEVDLTLKPGVVSQTVKVSTAPPLLQTHEGSVGQVISTKTINDTPLNGRNWVYIAQLTAGVVSTHGGSRGAGTGDFVANGQSAEQNNFILDGVDNNTSLVDFLNGASYVVRPPPDALAEFKIQTSNYSAEFGHSSGAVVNASIKSGTNEVHGDAWEYFRNTALDARNWNAPKESPYHENQFGATLGLPIIKNKLFWFGDAEANRISFGGTYTYSVPTPKMRNGDFSELLNTSLTGQAHPIYLYDANSGGNPDKTGQSTENRLSCNGQANVICPSQVNPVAKNLLSLFPQEAGPNVGKTYSNLVENVTQRDNTWQWDQRMDWDISQKDQAYARYSYLHYQVLWDTPFGSILDGSGYGGYKDSSLAGNAMLSETHVFSPTLTNEFRFGYSWGRFLFLQENADKNISAELGLGGVPFGPDTPMNGGIPSFRVSGITGFGTPGTSTESQNVYQILDNVTKVAGKHTFKAGVALQNLRFFYRYASASRGWYYYTGRYTSSPASRIPTGSGTADLLLNQMAEAYITNAPNINNQEWYNSAYVEDTWRILPRLTLNLGIRYDYFQPYKEMSGSQANLLIHSLGMGTGSATYVVQNTHKVPLGEQFTDLLADNNITIQNATNPRLRTAQKANFAPRVGFALRPDSKSVLSGGFGVFYGGLQNAGGANLGNNFPFALSATIPTPSCGYGNCPSIGVTLEDGLSQHLANGLQNFVSQPNVRMMDSEIKTPYVMSYNLTMQHALSNSMIASIGYVGNISRHVELQNTPNSPRALLAHGKSTLDMEPFPGLGYIVWVNYSGVATYNALQAKLQKRYSNGLSFLSTYTWGHNLSDASDVGLQSAVGYRQNALIPNILEYTNSPFDIRNRFTFNGHYDLPFGRGRAYLNSAPAVVDNLLGGWALSLTYQAQTGFPFTVTPNISTASGGSARAIMVRDPFGAGGSPDPSNANVSCAQTTRNKDHWYNPCAFANPLPGNTITTPVTDTATVIQYLGGRNNVLYGPGYRRTNVSLFKTFKTWREQSLQLRADAFNLFNHPSLNTPSITTNNSNGGKITGPQSFQTNTPDARFLQLAVKYVF